MHQQREVNDHPTGPKPGLQYARKGAALTGLPPAAAGPETKAQKRHFTKAFPTKLEPSPDMQKPNHELVIPKGAQGSKLDRVSGKQPVYSAS